MNKLFIKNDIFSISSNLLEELDKSRSTQCSTMGLISESFPFVRDAWSFCRASRWKRFSMSKFIFFRTLSGLGSAWAREMRKKFHHFISKLKIEFHRFLLPFPRFIVKCFSPSTSRLFIRCQDDVKWRQAHLLVQRVQAQRRNR